MRKNILKLKYKHDFKRLYLNFRIVTLCYQHVNTGNLNNCKINNLYDVIYIATRQISKLIDA